MQMTMRIILPSGKKLEVDYRTQEKETMHEKLEGVKLEFEDSVFYIRSEEKNTFEKLSIWIQKQATTLKSELKEIRRLKNGRKRMEKENKWIKSLLNRLRKEMRMTEEMLNWFGSFFFGLQHLGIRIENNIERLSGLFQSSWMLTHFVIANEKVAKAFHEIWNNELAEKLGLIQLVLTEEDQVKQRRILILFKDNLGDLTKMQINNFGTKAKSANNKEDRIKMQTFFEI
jgi:hypothetical protein